MFGFKLHTRPANAAAPEQFPPKEQRLVEKAIRRIVRANDVQSRAMAKACGLTSAQLVICKGIVQLGEVTSAALSAYADLSPATVVTILDNLEERGIIQRYRSLSDRRIVHTRLTAEGAALVARAPSPLGDTLISRLAALPPAQRKAMIEAVTGLAALMERDRPAPQNGARDAPPAARP